MFLGGLKRDGDRVIPMKKGDLLLRLVEWMGGFALSVVEEEKEVSITIDTAQIELKRA